MTSFAKINRPSLTNIVRRKRLFRLLDAERRHPVIWVTGSPGYGKTTLISSYLKERKLSHIWYQIDEGDADLASFFYYMGLAGKKAAPQKRKPLPLLTPEYMMGIPVFTLRYFENLFNRLKPPSVLVLDNYQDVPEDPLFHETISMGLSKIPEGINVIIISRREPPPALARTRANNAMGFLDSDNLKLNAGESAEIGRLLGKGKYSKDTIVKLHDRVEGWAAGLVLLIGHSVPDNLGTQLLESSAPQVVFDYFACEVFRKADRKTQEFLLKSAFLPKITVPAAKELTGLGSAGKILTELNRDNFFTVKHAGQDPAYEYHQMFREFLVNNCRETYSKEDVIRLKRKAAALLEASGHVGEAVELFGETGDLEEIAKLIFKHAPSLLAQGRNRTLEAWLSKFPEDVLDNTPWLLFWLGASRFPFNSPEGKQLFERSFELFRANKDVAGIFLSWSSIVESIIFEFEALTRLDRWISTLDELLKEYQELPPGEINTRVAVSMFSALTMRQPYHPEFSSWMERATVLAEKTQNMEVRIQTILNLVYHDMNISGDSGVQCLIDSLRGGIRYRHVTPFAMLRLKLAEVLLDSGLGNFNKSLKTVKEALELANDSGIHIMDYTFWGHGALSALQISDFDEAARYLQAMEETFGKVRIWDQSFFYIMKVCEAWRKGDVRSAAAYADLNAEVVKHVGSYFVDYTSCIAKSQIMLELGDTIAAEEQLKAARLIERRVRSKTYPFVSLAAESQLNFEKGNENAGFSSLHKAMAVGKKSAYICPFLWLPHVIARLCTKALEKGIETEYVTDLVRKYNLFPDTPPLEIGNWPWAVKISTLGRFRLELDGKPAGSSGSKAQKKPIEMLKALTAFGGRDVSEDEIIDALWPESDGDTAQQSFRTTLHRLRKLLGSENAIQSYHESVSINQRLCWVDTWAFERLIDLSDAAADKGQTDKAIRYCRKAIEIYKGHFLAKEPEHSWAISPRERLRGVFLNHIGRLGSGWEDSGEWKIAVGCYQKALEVDDLAEEVYQRLMICYQKLGLRAEALAVYSRCRLSIESAFGIGPSPETEKIYRSIVSE